MNPGGVIVLITGFSELVEEMQGGLELSASACLTKPLEVEDLVPAPKAGALRPGPKESAGFRPNGEPLQCRSLAVNRHQTIEIHHRARPGRYRIP